MLSAYYVSAPQIEANSINPDQTTPKGAVGYLFILFSKQAIKEHHKMRKQTSFVNGGKWLRWTECSFYCKSNSNWNNFMFNGASKYQSLIQTFLLLLIITRKLTHKCRLLITFANSSCRA